MKLPEMVDAHRLQSLSLSLSLQMHVRVCVNAYHHQYWKTLLLNSPYFPCCVLLPKEDVENSSPAEGGSEEPEATDSKLSPRPLPMFGRFPRPSESRYELKRHISEPGALVYCHRAG